MSTPERAIFSNAEADSRGFTVLDVDPLEMAMEAIRKLKAAGLPTYIPAEAGAEIIELNDFRADRRSEPEQDPAPQKIVHTGEETDQTEVTDTLPQLLHEARRARNADLETRPPVRSNLPGTEHSPQAAPRPMTKAIEYALFNNAQNGDKTARERLAEKYMPLARSIAMKYMGRTESLDDLVQVASLGMVKAINRYDTTQGFAFSTFAVPTIHGEIKRYFRDHGWGMHVARGLQEKALELRKTVRELEQKNEEYTLESVGESLGLTYEKTIEAWLVMEDGRYVTSLDTPIGSDGETDATLADLVADNADEETLIDKIAGKLEIQKILAHCSDRDKEIFVRHIMLDQTQKETADALGISQMHVSRIIRRMKEGDYYAWPANHRRHHKSRRALPPGERTA